jgi:RimJ/RimL family protein N-acetyltransferase
VTPAELTTPRLRLYAPRIEDLEARLAMERDPAVMRYIRPVPRDAAAQREDLRADLDGPPGRCAFWHVAERAHPAFLG